MTTVLILLLFVESIILTYFFIKELALSRKNRELQSALQTQQQHLEDQKVNFQQERETIRKTSKMRSGAVSWGKTIEHFVPFIDKFPIAPEDVIYLGQPIDYIGFTKIGSDTECTVHLIEVKSGSAFLQENQKNIKKAVEEGRVKWHEVRVKSNKVLE